MPLKDKKFLFWLPHPGLTPSLGVTPANFVMKFGVRKLESWATRWWRNHDASFLRFDTIPACDRQTDGYVALAKTCTCIVSRE